MSDMHDTQSTDNSRNMFISKWQQQENHIQQLHLTVFAKDTHSETEWQKFEKDRNRGVFEATCELYGEQLWAWFLRNSLINASSASADSEDLYQDFLLHLWLSFSSFNWKCSLRTWCFRLAFHTIVKGAKTQNKEMRNRVSGDVLVYARDTVRRLSTHKFPLDTKCLNLQNEVLTPEEIQVIHLHVYQQFCWNDIAALYMMSSSDNIDDVSAKDMKREAARLRQMYCRAKMKLRAEAEARGWTR